MCHKERKSDEGGIRMGGQADALELNASPAGGARIMTTVRTHLTE